MILAPMSSIPPNDADAYREQLAAAHARIEALEAELAGKNGAGVSSPKIVELERQREQVIEKGSPEKVRRQALSITLVPTIMFGLIAVFLWRSQHPARLADLVSLPIVVVAVGGLLGLFIVLATPASTRAAVAKLDREIAEARRVLALEAEVRETRRRQRASKDSAQARVAAPLEETKEPDAPSAERWREK